MGEGLLGKIFGKGKNTESGSVGGAVAEAVGARALGGLENAMTLNFKDGKSLNDPENENKICIEDNLIYELINQCTNGELDKKVKKTKNALGITSSLTISKDTLQKFREVIKNEDLAKALQMSGSVAQVASLGVLVVAVGMLKKANDQLSELNLSVSRIKEERKMDYYVMLNSEDGDKILYILAAAFAGFMIWLLIREVICWYYKINDRVTLMQEENAQLRKQNTYLYQIAVNTYLICQHFGLNSNATPPEQVQPTVQQMNPTVHNSAGTAPMVPSNPGSVNPMNTTPQS